MNYYRLPRWESQMGSPVGTLYADLSGTFTVAPGSVQEAALLAAGAVETLPSGLSIDSEALPDYAAVLIGDSITYRGQYNTGGTTVAALMDGWYTWMNALLRGRFTLVGQCAVNGQTTGNMLARFATGITGKLDGSNDPLAYSANWYFVLGGVNDLQIGVSSYQVFANLRAMCARLLATGARVCLLTMMPTSTNIGISTGICEVNQAIRAFCRSTPRMVCADVFAAMVNPLSSAALTATGVGDATPSVHPTAYGAYLAGAEVAKVIGPFLAPRTDRVSANYDSVYNGAGALRQLVTNPVFGSSSETGLATGTVGSQPSGWTSGSTTAPGDFYFGSWSGFASGTSTIQTASVSGIGRAWQLAYTVNSSAISNAAPAEWFISPNAVENTYQKIVNGDVIRAECDVDMSAYTGDFSMFLRLFFTVGGNAVEAWWGNIFAPGAIEYYATGAAPSSFTMRTPELVIPSGTISSGGGVQIGMFSDTNSSTGTVQFSRCSILRN